MDQRVPLTRRKWTGRAPERPCARSSPGVSHSRVGGSAAILKSMDVLNLDAVPAFTTKDGSEIRELLA